MTTIDLPCGCQLVATAKARPDGLVDIQQPDAIKLSLVWCSSHKLANRLAQMAAKYKAFTITVSESGRIIEFAAEDDTYLTGVLEDGNIAEAIETFAQLLNL